MGLSASMWTSVSGLLAHGNKMNVVGNNIANVSTIGFKSQRMDFNDYLYINGGSTSGPVQIGAGVSTYAVLGDFSQGSLESTNSVTDIAIDGEGFFKVRKPNTDQMYYTRAGDFYFNADRQLQNPEGYRLQGWKVDNSTRLTFKSESINLGKDKANESAFVGTGTPQDIVLDSWYLEPQRTTSVSFTMGLTSDSRGDRSTSDTSPMTALFDQWDASKNPPMPDTSCATSSAIKVYDEGGNAHTLTVYYDQVAAQQVDSDGNTIYEIEGLPAGYTVYEYAVTIPPEEDMRSYGGTKYNEKTNTWEGDQPTKFYNDPVKGTNKNAGMLMTGHLIFDAAGNLVNQTAYTYGANADPGDLNQCDLDPKNLSSWQSTRFSSNGLPTFCANFTGQPLANSVSETISPTQSQAQDYIIELDFGLRCVSNWDNAGSLADLRGTESDPQKVPSKVTVSSKPSYDTPNFYWDNGKQQWTSADNTQTIPASADTVLYYQNPTTKKWEAATNEDGTLKDGIPAAGPFRQETWNDYVPANTLKRMNELGQTDLMDADNNVVGTVDPDTGLITITKTGYNGPLYFENEVTSRTISYNNDVSKYGDPLKTDNASSAGSSSYITQDAHADGYPSGVLSGTNIDNAGVVYGYYDNGETIPLYQIALYDFHNKQGLRREGGNLYGQTKESGEARQGVAGDNGFGVTRAYNIEGSNVDLSREFVNMITTQRGFQANSKGVTTVDTMLETVIGMKR
ncbi:flagellar hook-basal body complex protein [Desulfovibrio sp.]|uniref:flagellar hook-basal body complex protein n=1 Tax=Desulfovibrio sp. TaxID=885 RepID=UPI0023BF2C1E|nr:flagellar hook-basal body complex protein [Desulfovibrio sp.]MDE7241997.1 flagellar hook-basal body complex protein [Desulfovibrio sp.]